ncbi:MAG: ATP-binding protein [Candidatus Rokuibacteriota bacterium]|nr:MAG: ATP-binding protein [Candidatus Rokubacteria bacterium]
METGTSDCGRGGGYHHRTFAARRRALPEVTAFVADVCEAARLGREPSLRLRLLIEELFTNTLEHGYGGDSDGPVELAFEVGSDAIALTYEDAAPPHDPFAALSPPDERTAVEERGVGGLGVLLVAAMAEQVRYRRAGDRNRISLVVRAAR